MKRTAPLRRHTPLSPISRRRRVVSKEYTKLRRTFLESRPVCECCGTQSAQDVHHRAGRLGGNMLKVSTWMAVCRYCHDTIHRFPKWAKARGFLGGAA